MTDIWPQIEAFIQGIYESRKDKRGSQDYYYRTALMIMVYHEYPIYINNPEAFPKRRLIFLKWALQYLTDNHRRLFKLDDSRWAELWNMMLNIHKREGHLKYALTHAQMHNCMQIPSIIENMDIKEWCQQVFETSQERYVLDTQSMRKIAKKLLELIQENEALRLQPGGLEYTKAKERFTELAKID